MSSDKEMSELWRKQLRIFGMKQAAHLRAFGIEVTPEESEQMAREALIEAVRQNLVQMFLGFIQGGGDARHPGD